MGLMSGLGIGVAIVSASMVMNGRGNELVDFGGKAVSSIVDLINGLLFKGSQFIKGNENRHNAEEKAKQEAEQTEEQDKTEKETAEEENPSYKETEGKAKEIAENTEMGKDNLKNRVDKSEEDLSTSNENNEQSITDKKVKNGDVVKPEQNGKIDSIDQAIYKTNGLDQTQLDKGLKMLEQKTGLSR